MTPANYSSRTARSSSMQPQDGDAHGRNSGDRRSRSAPYHFFETNPALKFAARRAADALDYRGRHRGAVEPDKPATCVERSPASAVVYGFAAR